MYRENTINNIPYKDYTDTSNVSGFADTTAKTDCLLNIIKNTVFVYYVHTSPKDEERLPQRKEDTQI